MKRMRIRKRSKRRKSSNRLKNQLPKQRQEANPRCQRHHQRLSKGKNRSQRPKPKEVPRTKRRRNKRGRKKRRTKRKTPLHLSKGLLPKVVPETKSPSSSLGCQKRKKRLRRLREKKKKKKKWENRMNVWILMVTMKSVPKVLVEVQQAAQSRKSSSTDQGDLEKIWNQGRKNHVGGLLVARRTPRQAAGKCRQTIPASEAGWRDLWQELWQRCPDQFSTCNHAPSLLPWRCWCLQPGAGQWWHHRGHPRRKSDVQVWYLRSGRAKESDQRINKWVKTCLLAETKKLKPIHAYCQSGCCWHKHKSKHTQVDDINNLGEKGKSYE